MVKAILISSLQLSPLRREQPIQAAPETVFHCGHYPQANQQLKYELRIGFPNLGAMGQYKPRQGQRTLGLFKCPTEHPAHVSAFAEQLFENYR